MVLHLLKSKIPWTGQVSPQYHNMPQDNSSRFTDFSQSIMKSLTYAQYFQYYIHWKSLYKLYIGTKTQSMMQTFISNRNHPLKFLYQFRQPFFHTIHSSCLPCFIETIDHVQSVAFSPSNITLSRISLTLKSRLMNDVCAFHPR